MPPTIGGITIDPQGQTLTVSVTPAAKVYTDAAGTTLASFPATVSTRTSYWMTAAQQYTVSVKTAAGNEIADKSGNALVVDVQQGVMEGIAPVMDRPVANGYAGLGAGGLVPVAQLGTGTPTGSKFLRDDNTFAVPAGGGSTTGTENGVINATDAAYGMVADALSVTDGAVAGGALSTLTSASALFTSGDVGKTVTLMRFVNITDASISSGTPTLTSATNLVPAWVVANMPVRMSSAGASNFSLSTTVLTNDGVGQLTLNANASATVASRNALVMAIHRTTISAFTNSTTVSLTAAAPYAFSGATVVWGTDNRAAFQLAAAAAVAAGKTLFVPGGDYLLALDATNPSGYQTLTSTLTMRGAGRFATRFHFAADSVSTADTQLILAGTGCQVDLADFKVSSYQPPYFRDSIMYGRILKFNKAGTTSHTIRLRNIDTDSVLRPDGAFYMGSGSGTAAVNIHIDDCRFFTTTIACNFFVNTGTVARVWMNGTRCDNNTYMYTTANDAGYNAHAIYIHPSVARSFKDCRLAILNSPGPQGAYHVHDNGSPTDVPDFVKYEGVILEAGRGSGILAQNNAALVEVKGCQFFVSGVQLSAPAVVSDCVFAATAGKISITGTGNKVVIRNPTFLQTTTGLTPIDTSSATGTNTIIVEDAIIAYLTNWTGDIIGLSSSQAQNLDLIACRITGMTGAANGVVQARIGHKIRVIGGVYTGTSSQGLFYCSGAAGTVTGYCRLQDVDFTGVTGTAVFDQTATGTDGPFRVYNCLFGASVGCVNSGGRSGNQFAARPFTSPTALTSANPLVLDHDFARYTCSPGAAINIDNVYRNTVARTRMCSEEVIIRNTAAAGSGFNLVFKNLTGNLRGSNAGTAGDVTITPGEMALLIGDGTGNWDVRNLG